MEGVEPLRESFLLVNVTHHCQAEKRFSSDKLEVNHLFFTAHVGIVQKVARGRRNPPSMGSTVQDWLNYVCATGGDISPSDNTAPSSFDKPRERSESMTASGKVASKERRASIGFRYEHETEAIFAIPKFEMEFRSEHDMPMTSIASKWVRKQKW